MKLVTIFKLFPFFWLIGLELPLMYSFLISNLKYLYTKKDKVLIFGFFFILLQFISIYLSIYNIYFDPVRIVASIHNTFVYFFLLLGYSLSLRLEQHEINKIMKLIFIWLIFLSIFSICFYYLTHSEFLYQIYNLKIQFFRIAFFSGWEYPRLLIFSDYPNGVAILLFLIFGLYLYTSTKPKSIKHLIFGLIFIALEFFTGSRVVMLLSILLVILIFIDKQWKYSLLFILGLYAILFIYLSGFFDFLLNSREGSNTMRALIYKLSITTWLDTNLLFGIGLKPYVNGMNYPLGSHSTILGAFMKFGLIGGSMLLFLYILLLFSVLSKLFTMFISNFKHNELIIHYTLLALLIILWIEDIDALELNALLVGIVIGYTTNNFTQKRNVYEK